MKRTLCLLLLCGLLAGCGADPHPGSSQATTEATTEATTAPTLPPHSQLYIEGLTLEQVIEYYNEVVLDAEFSTGGGNASLVQKWNNPIYYEVYGTPTQEDLQAIEGMVRQLNAIHGFPGLYPADDTHYRDLDIHFCTGPELVDLLGSDFSETDYGATVFWYDANEIYSSTICVRNDIDQTERISVILEEIYNTLGPVQDTTLREDSIIYQYSNENLVLSDVDLLLLQLLYHPEILCGMDAEECARIIQTLYY